MVAKTRNNESSRVVESTTTNVNNEEDTDLLGALMGALGDLVGSAFQSLSTAASAATTETKEEEMVETANKTPRPPPMAPTQAQADASDAATAAALRTVQERLPYYPFFGTMERHPTKIPDGWKSQQPKTKQQKNKPKPPPAPVVEIPELSASSSVATKGKPNGLATMKKTSASSSTNIGLRSLEFQQRAEATRRALLEARLALEESTRATISTPAQEEAETTTIAPADATEPSQVGAPNVASSSSSSAVDMTPTVQEESMDLSDNKAVEIQERKQNEEMTRRALLEARLAMNVKASPAATAKELEQPVAKAERKPPQSKDTHIDDDDDDDDKASIKQESPVSSTDTFIMMDDDKRNKVEAAARSRLEPRLDTLTKAAIAAATTATPIMELPPSASQDDETPTSSSSSSSFSSSPFTMDQNKETTTTIATAEASTEDSSSVTVVAADGGKATEEQKRKAEAVARALLKRRLAMEQRGATKEALRDEKTRASRPQSQETEAGDKAVAQPVGWESPTTKESTMPLADQKEQAARKLLEARLALDAKSKSKQKEAPSRTSESKMLTTATSNGKESPPPNKVSSSSAATTSQRPLKSGKLLSADEALKARLESMAAEVSEAPSAPDLSSPASNRKAPVVELVPGSGLKVAMPGPKRRRQEPPPAATAAEPQQSTDTETTSSSSAPSSRGSSASTGSPATTGTSTFAKKTYAEITARNLLEARLASKAASRRPASSSDNSQGEEDKTKAAMISPTAAGTQEEVKNGIKDTSERTQRRILEARLANERKKSLSSGSSSAG
jgi:hypothetical protein